MSSDSIGRTSHHSNGQRHTSLRGYDATGWPTLAAHLHTDGTPDELFFYSVDAGQTKGRTQTFSTARFGARVIRTVYKERLEHKNIEKTRLVPVSPVLSFCTPFCIPSILVFALVIVTDFCSSSSSAGIVSVSQLPSTDFNTMTDRLLPSQSSTHAASFTQEECATLPGARVSYPSVPNVMTER